MPNPRLKYEGKTRRPDQTNSKNHKLWSGCSRGCIERERERWSQSQTKVSYAETKLPAAVDKWVCVYLVAVSYVSYVLSPGCNTHIRIYVTNNAAIAGCASARGRAKKKMRRRGRPSCHSPTLNLPQHKSYLLTEMQIHTHIVRSICYTIYKSKWFNYFASARMQLIFNS